MKKTLIFVRHGQSEWNIDNRIQGTTNTKLTAKGKMQAERLALELSRYNIDKIYSSCLERAENTALTVGAVINKPINLESSFNEMNFGIWQGKTMKEIEINHNKDFNIWMKEPDKLNLENAENLKSLREKLAPKLEEIIISMDDQETVLIVTHGTTLKTAILTLLDMPLSNYKNFAISNVSISLIEVRDYNNVLVKLNDTNYLEAYNE